MNKLTGIILGIVIIIIIAGVAYASLMQREDEMVDAKMEEAGMMDEKMMSPEDEKMMADEKEMAAPGVYESYAPEKLARAETGDVVLFFHASWCPSCRGLNADIEKNLDAIPSGVNILKVDYDSETELKKKYGITYQHTLVQVAADGTMINKWSGSPTLSSVVSNIN